MHQKALLVLCSLFVVHCSLMGQTVLLEQTVPDSGAATHFGQNRRHYMGVMLGFGVVIPDGDNQFPVRFGSGNVDAGLFYKLRITGLLALVGEVGYRREQLNIQQTDEKIVPSNTKWERERLVVHSLPLALNLRVNFDPRRGNMVGKFLDLGAVYLPTIGSTHRYSTIPIDDQDLAPPEPPQKIIVVNRGLYYIASSDYAAQVRIGLNRIMLTARYRLGDLLKPNYFQESSSSAYLTPEWPRLSIGLQIGLY